MGACVFRRSNGHFLARQLRFDANTDDVVLAVIVNVVVERKPALGERGVEAVHIPRLRRLGILRPRGAVQESENLGSVAPRCCCHVGPGGALLKGLGWQNFFHDHDEQFERGVGRHRGDVIHGHASSSRTLHSNRVQHPPRTNGCKNAREHRARGPLGERDGVHVHSPTRG